ncbi:MAG: type IV pilus biogenesis/stability protein PilW [Porticoccaceae bacterium]|jgi:type IV pilus assembly protein PilF
MRLAMSPPGVLVALLTTTLLVAGCATEVKTKGAVRSKPISMDQALQDHIQLGLSYVGEGNRDAARHHLAKALEIDPRSPGAHNGMALLYQLEQESSLAEKHYKRAIAYDRDFTRARNNYGVFLAQQERVEEAYDEFRRVTEDTGYGFRAQAFVSLGIAASSLGRQEEAVEAWSRAIVLNPRLAQPYLELAEYHLGRDEYPQAGRYLAAFDSLARPSARSLWLGLRIERRFGNKDAVASKALALSKLFPYSQENLEYQEWLRHEQQQ